MKLLFIYIILFILVITLVSLLDILQGFGFSEVIQGFIKIKQKLTVEELLRAVPHYTVFLASFPLSVQPTLQKEEIFITLFSRLPIVLIVNHKY